MAARALAVAITVGIALALAAPLIAAAGSWFIGGGPEVTAALTTYVVIRLLASPFALANYAILGYVLGRGESLAGLGLQVLINGANIALSVWLGLGLGWGIEGVAWGTVWAEALGAAAGFALLARRFGGAPRLRAAEILDPDALRRMLALNADIMVRSFALLFAFALFARQGAQLGEVTLAANAVLINFFLVAGYFLDGFATAAEQLAGRAVGAQRRDAFADAVRLSAIWGFALSGIVAAVALAGGERAIALVTTSPEVRQAASACLPWAAFTATSGVLAFLMDGVYIGATWSRDMRNMMLLSLAIFAAALWALGAQFGNHGLWAAMHLFLIVRGLSLSAMLPRRMRATFAA